jgi:hypothetical protein
VDPRGFEPLTPCMPCRCATSCATGPFVAEATVQVYNNLSLRDYIQLDYWLIAVETFQRVIHAVFFMHYVADNVAEV